METLTPAASCRHATIHVTTARATEFIDLTVLLGRWQRVFLVELDGPRERALSVLVFGEAGR